MALYTFENEDTHEEITIDCKIAEYPEVEKEMNEKNFFRVYVPIRLVDGANGDIYSKSDGGWKETLQRIKAGSGKGNTIPV